MAPLPAPAMFAVFAVYAVFAIFATFTGVPESRQTSLPVPLWSRRGPTAGDNGVHPVSQAGQHPHHLHPLQPHPGGPARGSPSPRACVCTQMLLVAQIQDRSPFPPLLSALGEGGEGGKGIRRDAR